MKATQKELFDAERFRPEPPCWYVTIDEVKLNAVDSPAAEYWAIHSARWEQSGQAKVLDICIAGAIVRLGPFERDDAEFIRDHLLEKGAHPKAITVKRIKSDTAGRAA